MNLVSKEMIINYSCLQELAFFFSLSVCVCVEKTSNSETVVYPQGISYGTVMKAQVS